MSSLLIFGAGGHGKVVADTAMRMKRWNNIAFVDDKFPSLEVVIGCPIVADISEGKSLVGNYADAAVAIGENSMRLVLANELRKLGFRLPAIIHPSASIASSSRIADAAVVFANAVIQPDAAIGFAAIVNTAATVDHDCLISDSAHISPGVHLSGGVHVGSCSWIGIGSSVTQNIRVGHRVTIGGGSCVITDIEDNSVAVGVPAKVIRNNTG